MMCECMFIISYNTMIIIIGLVYTHTYIQSLQSYREYLIECSKIKWQIEISEVPVGSNSGGRFYSFV